MSEIVNSTLQKVAKGTGIVFFGTIAGIFLTFIGRVIIARFFTQAEYGIFSLAFVLLNFFAVVSTFGLRQGSARQIAYYRGKNDLVKVQGIVTSSLQIVVIGSILVSIVIFFASDVISTMIFHEPNLSYPLKIFSIAIPFFALIHVLASVFRGFDEVKPRIYFENILRNAIFFLLLMPVIVFGLSFSKAIYVFSASIIVSGIAFLVYTARRNIYTVKLKTSFVTNPVGGDLLIFSLPLLGIAMLHMIMTWTDTLMLGYYKTSDVVGLYNGAFPLARLISLTLGSMSFIWVPIISQLYAQDLKEEMRRSYQVLTKWIFSISFPVFLLLLLFPETILSFFFSARYAEAALALQILSLGFIFHTFLGVNALTLLVMGKSRLLMLGSLIAATLNIILNVSLIPVWGIVGAATASFVAYFAVNTFNSIKLYQFSKIHPFTQSYLKPIIASCIPLFIIYGLISNLGSVSFWMLPIIFILFLGIYVIFFILTKSFDEEDITFLLAVEKKLGLNLRFAKNILKKYT